MKILNSADLDQVQGGLTVDLEMDFDGFIHLDIRLTQEEALEGGVTLLTGADTDRNGSD